MTVCYVDFTKKLVNDLICNNILLVGGQSPLAACRHYDVTDISGVTIGKKYDIDISKNRKRKYVIEPRPGLDLVDFLSYYKNFTKHPQFEAVIMLRVLEHIEARQVDWYLYNIRSVMEEGAKLYLVVPDMWQVVQKIRQVTEQGIKNQYFKFLRLNYELLSEGEHVFDRHALWTDEHSVKEILELEKMFKVEKIEKVRLDTDIVPHELFVVAVAN